MKRRSVVIIGVVALAAAVVSALPATGLFAGPDGAQDCGCLQGNECTCGDNCRCGEACACCPACTCGADCKCSEGQRCSPGCKCG
jgi:hypothetical protein